MLNKQEKRYKRHCRIRTKVSGTADRPRLCVFRSSQHIYAQLINDQKGMTLVEASDSGLKKSFSQDKKSKQGAVRTKRVGIAYQVGKLVAERALKNKIERVVFDKSGYKYHGQVKALAEGAREGGLKF